MPNAHITPDDPEDQNTVQCATKHNSMVVDQLSMLSSKEMINQLKIILTNTVQITESLPGITSLACLSILGSFWSQDRWDVGEGEEASLVTTETGWDCLT